MKKHIVKTVSTNLHKILVPEAFADLTGNITPTQHGNLAGGLLHAVATTILAGFMSAADKVILDALALARTHVRVTSEAGQVFNDGVLDTIIYDTVEYDTLGEYDDSTGIFTAGQAGYYNFCASLQSEAGATGLQTWQIFMYIDAVLKCAGEQDFRESGGTFSLNSAFSTGVSLSAGDRVTIKCLSASGPATQSSSSSPSTNFVSIDRIW